MSAAVGLVAPWRPPAGSERLWAALQAAVGWLERPPVCASEPEVWFPERVTVKRLEVAVTGCSWCPVREACAAYAVAAGEREGVWGGTTPEERRLAAAGSPT